MKNILYYKYVQICNLEEYRETHWKFCHSLGLKGKILLASEGINGCLTGDDDSVQSYMETMHGDTRFFDMAFKITPAQSHSFNKLIVRIRKQIITTTGWDADPTRAAPYIEPEDFKKEIKDGAITVIDARNEYEWKIGKFKNAITPRIATFSQFAQFAKGIRHLKDKPVVTYCTGGIRCEKASAHLIENGFTDVRQLHGGIIAYGNACSNIGWEGKCFVFDTRGAIDVDPEKRSEPITSCDICSLPSDTYHNCSNANCDKRFISCDGCHAIFKGACSKRCRNTIRIE
jgi:UPF0176 protein